MEISTLLLTVLFLPIAYFLWREFTCKRHFESKGIPYLGNGLILGLKNYLNDVLIFQDMNNIYNDLKSRGLKLGGRNDFGVNTLFVADPDLIKDILVKNFDHFVDRRQLNNSKHDYLLGKMLFASRGQKWNALRSQLSPAFSTAKIRGLYPIFEDSAEKLVKYIRSESSNNEVELVTAFAKYTVDIIAKAACGIDAKVFEQKEANCFELMSRKLQVDFKGLKTIKLLLLVTSQRLGNLLGLSFFEKKVQDYFLEAIRKIIKERHETKKGQFDYIQLMLEAREDSSPKRIEREAQHFENGGGTSELSAEFEVENLLDDDGIVANSVMFLMAGFDTVRSLLLFLPYVLALNPDVQDRLRLEIRTVMKRHQGRFTSEAIAEMTYLGMVVNETLRMYTPALGLDRGCVKDYKVPGTEYTVRKGETVVVPIYPLHHDPDFYPDPDIFNPERFSPENKGNISPYLYLPFGVGPRSCIGIRFAYANVKVALASLVMHFDIRPSKRTSVPMKFARTALLKPDGELYLSLRNLHCDELK